MISSQQHSTLQEDYQFINRSNDPDTLVMLRNLEKMAYLQRQSPDNSHAILPNYYFLHNPKIAIRQKMTLKAALNQKTDRERMVGQFCRLAKRYFVAYKYEIDYFLNQYSHQQIKDLNNILKQYTKQGFFYQLLNRLLKGGKDPLELFYAQYFTKMLHAAIKKEHEKQKRKKFTCFRGALLSNNEIDQLKQNIGKHIQTLGFLSTSLDLQIALSFMGNALFEIEVQQVNRCADSDYGYAFLDSSSKSEQQKEKEVLFNTLCSFQIMKIGKQCRNGVQCLVVQMRYGISYYVLEKYKTNNSLLGEQEQIFLPCLLEQEQRSSSSQIEAIGMYPQLTSQYIQYCKKAIYLWSNNLQCPEKRNQKVMLYESAMYYRLREQKSISKSESDFLQHYETINNISFNENIFSDAPLTDSIIKLMNSAIMKIDQQRYEQADHLYETAKGQLQALQNDPTMKFCDFIEQMKQQIKVEHMFVKIRIEKQSSQYYLNIFKQVLEEKMNMQIKHGKYHPRYHQWVELELGCRDKLFTFQCKLQIEMIKFKFITGVWVDLNTWKALETNLLQIESAIKSGSYTSLISLIKNCANQFNKISADQWNKQFWIYFLQIIKKQLERTLVNMEYTKAEEIVRVVSELEDQQVINQVISSNFKQVINQTFQLQLIAVDSLRLFNRIRISSALLLQKMNESRRKMKENLANSNVCQFWLEQCMRVSVLKRMGKYEEADQLCLDILTKSAKSTYFEIIAEHLEAEDYCAQV